MDTLYAERDLCGAIVALGKDYLVRVKGNRPAVWDALSTGLADPDLGPARAATSEKSRSHHDPAALDRCRDGRLPPRGTGLPRSAPGGGSGKTNLTLATGELTQERWYLLNSLAPGRCGPADLLRLFRGHWSIENSLHHVKDRSWYEDRHTLRRPGLGEVFATLVNVSLNVLRQEEWFPEKMSLPLRAKTCAFRPRQTIARLFGHPP